jgi:hypothetical protein
MQQGDGLCLGRHTLPDAPERAFNPPGALPRARRTNKLADGCYSFWVGALFPLLQQLEPAALRTLAPPGGGASHAPASFSVPPLPPLHGVLGPREQVGRQDGSCRAADA